MYINRDSFPPGAPEALAVVTLGFVCLFLASGWPNCWLKRNWTDFVPSAILFAANFLLFFNYGSDVFIQGQVSSAVVLLASGTLAQLTVWIYQLWINPRLCDAGYLRAALGVSIYLDTWGLITTCVQGGNFGWTRGNIASLVMGLLSLLFAGIFVLREGIRGRALWRRLREVRSRAVDD